MPKTGVFGVNFRQVSMKSGLEGRNNGLVSRPSPIRVLRVSMKSGLEGRNNRWNPFEDAPIKTSQ